MLCDICRSRDRTGFGPHPYIWKHRDSGLFTIPSPAPTVTLLAIGSGRGGISCEHYTHHLLHILYVFYESCQSCLSDQPGVAMLLLFDLIMTYYTTTPQLEENYKTFKRTKMKTTLQVSAHTIFLNLINNVNVRATSKFWLNLPITNHPQR